MEKISETFARSFEYWDIHLPDPLPQKGTITEGGWTIDYVVLNDENGQPCLEYLASHRMTNTRHVRILSDGEEVNLPTLEDDYGYDPDVPGDREAAKARMRAHNQAVIEDLKAKGLW